MAGPTAFSLVFALGVTAGVWQLQAVLAFVVLGARWPGLVLTLLVGLAWGTASMQHGLDARLPDALSDREMTAGFQVTGLPQWQSLEDADGRGFWRFDARLLPEQDSAWPGQHKVRLYWSGADAAPDVLAPGERWQGRLRLRRPRSWQNPYGADGERLALSRGLGATGKVVEATALDAVPAGVDGWRARVSARLRRWLAPWPLAAAMLPALVCGDRRYLTGDIRRMLSDTGTAHLIAISGLHVSLVALASWWLMRMILGVTSTLSGWQRQSVRLWALLPSLAVAAGYAALAGFAPSTMRALVMAMLVCLLLLWRRRWPPGRVLSAAVAVLLLMDPLLSLDSGFWMSVSVVALLCVLHGRGLPPWRIQLLLALVPGPLAAILFDSWGSSAWLVNLFLVPLFSLVLVPLALVGGLVPGAGPLLELAGRVLTLIQPFWLELARWPAMPFAGSLTASVLMSVALLLWLMPAGLTGRALSAVALVLVCVPACQEKPAFGDMELLAFDVGQGQAMAVVTREHLVLFDAGGSWPGGNAGDSVLWPWLRRQPQRLALVFASHGDQDHAGGLAGAGIRNGAPVFSGEPDRVAGSQACRPGQAWRLDGVHIRVLWPPPGLDLQRSNNRSCVVKVTASNGSVLLPGDIERPVEYWLARHEQIKADILQLPHHGSATSNSFTFLRAVDPGQVVAPAGFRNRFGHPASSIRRRLEAAHIPLFVTGESGMLRFHGELRRVAPEEWRKQSRWPWRERAPVLE